MAEDVSRLLVRWRTAGVIDEEIASRIRAFELEHAAPPSLRWPILLALAFGSLLFASGVLLFVSAHWDTMSPQARFGLVSLLVAMFHVAGAFAADRFAGMSTALHAIGTGALGGGIYLAGQIFNLDEHWPGGVMLWALGASIGWAVLRHPAQLAMASVLVPAWLGSEWYVATHQIAALGSTRVFAAGVVLLALAYFTAVTSGRGDARRRVVFWVGGIALIPALVFLAFASPDRTSTPRWAPPSAALYAVGWGVAIGLPLLVAVLLRGHAAWPMTLAVLWVLALFTVQPLGGMVSLYGSWAVGALALIAWGVTDSRRERINMGAAIFAATVIAFYFSEVMDKLGRSASLAGLGVLFLAGGWALERVRRRLILQARGGA